MTEELDLDALERIHCNEHHGPPHPDGCTFCQVSAELRATRAEREAIMARAERAEAAITRVRATYRSLTSYNQAPDHALDAVMSALRGDTE